MKKRLSLFLVVVLALGILTACGSEEKTELTISAAASLTDVLDELKTKFEAENEGVEVVASYASSGALQAQIEEGAPVDVFISAAEKQMDSLEESGFLLEDTRKTLLLNEVVLIAPYENDLEINSIEELKDDSISKIAIGDPASVPVGQYSEEIFINLSILDSIHEKLINAEDVRTVLSWVESGEVDCGLVYETDAFTLPEGVEIICKAPKDSYKEVTYPIAVIKDSQNAEMAKKFIEFLSSEDAKKVFESYGFGVK